MEILISKINFNICLLLEVTVDDGGGLLEDLLQGDKSQGGRCLGEKLTPLETTNDLNRVN